MKAAAATLTLLLFPAVAEAQALQCSVPATIARPHDALPTADDPQRVLPIGSYTLSLTWHPQTCRSRRADQWTRCAAGNRFGFTLHGLWPDGEGREWPQYCRPTELLPEPVIRANLCRTPSPQLLQHEWAKHGTCMPGYTPARYFEQSAALYANLRYPNMDALSRRPLKAGGLARAMARANPGLPADAVRVSATRDGWLDELWLCLDRRFAYASCRPDSGGVTPNRDIRIWRGHR